MLLSDFLEPRRHFAAIALSNKGTLSVAGTEAADVINVTRVGKYIRVGVNADGGRFLATQVKRIYVNAAAGNDRVVIASPIRSTLIGGPGNDKLIASSANDSLEGNGGRDTLIAGAGDDVLNAGPGPNLICPGDGNNTGTFRYEDTFDYFDGTPGEYGFSDTGLEIMSEADPVITVKHPTGQDIFNKPSDGAGRLTFIATPGDDTVRSVFGHTGVGAEYAVPVNATIHAGVGDDVLTFSDHGHLLGDAGNDHITQNGEDFFPDSADGGPGDDCYSIVNAHGSIDSDSGIGGNDTADLSFNAPDSYTYITMPDGIENLVIAHGDPDTVVIGNDLNNVIRMTDMNNVQVEGRGGNDMILISMNNATISGGDGDDFIDVDADSIDVDADSIGGIICTAILSGNAGNDTLLGTAGPDTLNGNGGVDRLFGRGGDDLLIANDGRRDTLDGGEGNDSARIDAGDLLANIENV